MIELGSKWMSRKNHLIIDKVVEEKGNKLVALYKMKGFDVYFTEAEINQMFVPILKENNK